MLRLVARNLSMNAKVACRQVPGAAVRAFSEKLSIPTDAEQQGGRRKIEIEFEAKGEAAYSNEPIIPDANQGTFENPILVSRIFY